MRCVCVFRSCSYSFHQLLFVVVQLLSHVSLFATPWIAACQASLSFTIAQSLLKLMSIESVMLSNRLILCCPLLLLPSIFPSIRVFPAESALRIRCPKYWNLWGCKELDTTEQLSNNKVVKNLPASAGDTRDTGSVPGSERSRRVGSGAPLQYSCLENSMDKGAWKAKVRGVTKNWT